MQPRLLPSTPLASLALLLALAVPLSLTACAAEGGGDGGDGAPCTGDKCDDLDKPDEDVTATACDGVMVDRSGRGNEKVAGRLHDPIAEAVFAAGDGCPTTFQDIFDKLAAADTENCDGEGAGMISRAISETAQVENKPTSYRLVTSRTCGDRENHGVLFSLFGVRAGAKTLPKNVEMISFDKSAGVFNYYETDGTTLNFFGNSNDMLKGTGDGDDRRCAGCHVGGGLIMKELEAPWVHWEGDTTTPGVSELITANKKFLGDQSDGIELEGTVGSANSTWNKTRLASLKKLGDTKELLRPLFCTQEINLNTEGPGGVSSIPSKMLLDPRLNNFNSVSIDQADYDALIAENGQSIEGTSAKDTFFPFAFAHRSAIDDDYIGQLISAGLVTEEFVKDILLVDFTRPIFSEDRCGLLELVPSIPVSEMNATKLKAGLLENIGTPAAGSPEAELKANLDKRGGHDTVVQAFTDACSARTPRDVLADALKVVSLNRDTARTFQVIEFAQTMPDDSLDVAEGTRLSPTDCTLGTEFVAATAVP